MGTLCRILVKNESINARRSGCLGSTSASEALTTAALSPASSSIAILVDWSAAGLDVEFEALVFNTECSAK